VAILNRREKQISIFTFIIYFVSIFYTTYGYSADFPLSSKGYSATIIIIKNIDSDNALAVGQVRRPNAEEYCNRDPGGETTKYGGRLTFQQCVDNVLKEERGKKVSATADCLRKKVTVDWGGTYVIKSKVWNDTYWEYTWVDDSSGAILDGSGASGAPVIEATFRMLCPAFIK
jgi:hypothetical protein